ncbi:MAG: hypothetical protein ABI630_02815 [Betaproteobacteria bacterium]
MNSLAAAPAASSQGAWILGLLRGLRIEGFERSFKIAHGALLEDRFLAGVHKADIAPPELYGLCTQMGMPAAHLASLRVHAEAADIFHFGFEGAPGGGLCKVYLEFARHAGQRGSEVDASRATLLHLAYKWGVADRSIATIARYERLPLSGGAIAGQVAAHFAAAGDGEVRAAAEAILALGVERMAHPPMYLEVREEGNPRASFDINLHDAAIALADLAPQLARVTAHFALPPATLERALARAGAARLGHLSGGTNRQGAAFLTLYYADAP